MARPRTHTGGGHSTGGAGDGGNPTRPRGDGDGSSRPRRRGSTEVPANVSRAQDQTAEFARQGRPGANRSPDTPGTQRPGTDPHDGGPGTHHGRDADADTARQHAREHPEEHSTPTRERTDAGDPVDVVSGDVFMAQTDVNLPGVLPLVLERTHVSSYRLGRAFGRSWASTLDMRLELDADGGAILVTADGMLLVYRRLPAWGVVHPEIGPRWALTATAGGFSVTPIGKGVSWHFTAPTGTGSATDTAGRPTVLPLTGIVHRCGDRIGLTRDEDGRVAELVHSGGYRVAVSWQGDRVTRLDLRDPVTEERTPLARFGYTDGGDQLTEVTNASGRPLRFDYDPAGRLTQWVDRNGHWYGYTYDGSGRCVAATGSGGYLATHLAYDEAARTTRVTDALGHVTTYTYGEHRRIVREVDPIGSVTLRDWDPAGRLAVVTDPTGATTRYAYDQHGNLVGVAAPDGAVTTVTYTADHQPATVTAPDGTSRTFAYDSRGNLHTATDPTGAVVTYAYDAAGHLAGVTDPLGATTTIESDGAGLPARIIDPAGSATSFERDAAGRIVRVVDPLGAVTTLSYTRDGLPAARTGPDGGVETWRHDPEGNLTVHTSPTGAVTRFEYTAFDQPTARIEPDGTRLVFGYDAQLRLTGVTNPQGLTWTYTYDPAGRLVAETDFNGRTLSYAHDPAGRLIACTNGLGQTTHFRRDAAGRPIERHSAEGVTRYGYDPAGRLQHAVSPTADMAMVYDPAGRLLAETVNGRTVSFTYDAAGRRTSRTTPTGAVSIWDYDSRHAPISLTTAGHTLTFVHDSIGNLVERTLATTAAWQTLRQAYDPAGRLVAQTLFAATGAPLGDGPVEEPPSARVVAHHGYAYRADGHLTATADRTASTRALTLDPVGRITAVTATGWSERYAYDVAGNLTAATWAIPAGLPTDQATVDAQGERTYTGTLIRRSGRYRFEHDPQGRVTLRQRAQHSDRPLTWRYAWDSDDRLTAVQTPDGTWWSYRYDPLGRRLGKYRHAPDGSITEQVDFTWDGMRLVEQTHHRPHSDTGPVVTTWDYQPDSFTPITQHERHWLATAPQPEIDQRFYTIVADLTGAPTHLTDVDGQVVWETLRTIWGTETAVSTTGVACPIRLPGQYYDPETGHHYSNQRYYDPVNGRFLTQDPLGLRPAPNPATYTKNPTINIDPLGLAPEGCGTATVNWYPGVGQRGHATITVTTADGQPLTTQQVIYGGWNGEGSPDGFPTTGAIVTPRQARELGSDPVTHSFDLTDAAAARQAQMDSVGARLGDYHGLDNSCVTYCVGVLRAGGVDIPEGRRGMIWLKKLLD